ncbi:MAG: hypothetical protein ABI581_17575, partial [Sediminibacterium sp.]
MKKILGCFLLFSVSCMSQDNTRWPADQTQPAFSGVSIPAVLTQQQHKSLDLLCRTWGVLKYFHPKLTGGKVNADKALFIIMPEVLTATDDQALGQLLYNWIIALGDIPAKPAKPFSSKAFIEPTFNWLQKHVMVTDNLRLKILEVIENRQSAGGYYNKPGDVGNPDFSNEFMYKNVKGEDDGMRMLGLFRYWNSVEYYFPSKQLTADNWDMVLQKMIPVFASSNTDLAYRMACLELVATIHDTHAAG